MKVPFGLPLIGLLGFTSAYAIDVEYPNSEGYVFADSEKQAIQSIAAATEIEVRALLPDLPNTLTLEIREGSDGSPSTGHGAQLLSPLVVGFVVDAARADGVESIVRAQLRSALFHELHHVVRGPPMSFMDTVISEGMATVFARDFGDVDTPWSSYSDDVVEWAVEVRNLEPGFNYSEWMFFHPDGRQYIGYTVGTYLVDRAVAASGNSAAELALTPTDEIVRMAELD